MESTREHENVYQLKEVLDWIITNRHRRLILQFKPDDLKHSVNIVQQLISEHEKRFKEHAGGDSSGYEPIDFYVSKTSTCCVDLIVTQHVSDVDAIIHFGNVCLSKPHIQNQEIDKRVLFAFNFVQDDDQLIEKQVDRIIDHLKSLHKENANRPTFVLYDPSLVDRARHLRYKLQGSDMKQYIDVANLNCPTPCWNTTQTNEPMLSRNIKDDKFIIGQYVLTKTVDQYKSAIYLGENLSNHLILHGPSNLWRIDCHENIDLEQVNVSRVLNKRMALVHRLRDDEELKIGVIITNPLPNISEMMHRMRSYARLKRHTLYFISMIQTIDECKIGNFDLCDAFVVINSCTCSSIVESLVFNRPILNDLELKLACGLEAEYGHVLWPGSESHPSEDDLLNRRKVSDVSLALVHMRNDLLERCSRSRTGLWSGMDYKAPLDPETEGTTDGICVESLNIEEGLKGIASTYISEPLRKPIEDNQSGATNSQAPFLPPPTTSTNT